ncbi:18892_t:CDS:2, partial [Rhizophagus irregularis]
QLNAKKTLSLWDSPPHKNQYHLFGVNHIVQGPVIYEILNEFKRINVRIESIK